MKSQNRWIATVACGALFLLQASCGGFDQIKVIDPASEQGRAGTPGPSSTPVMSVTPTPSSTPSSSATPTTPTPVATPTPSATSTPTMNGDWTPRNFGRMFLSGHSLTDNPLADYIVDLAAKNSDNFNFNQQIGIGSPIRVRTKGGSWALNSWNGYSTGKNRTGSNMNVVQELASPQTLGPGERYDMLVITERHDSLGVLQWEDTVGLLRHYHDRFITGNSTGRSYFYHSWLDIDKANPAAFIDFEKKAQVAWECAASKVNLTLQSDGRSDRMRSLPAGGAMVELVEKVLQDQVPGIAGTTTQKMNLIFQDNVHLTRLGAFYMAAVVHAATFGKSSIGRAPPADAGATQATATALQTIAWNFINSYYTQPNPGLRTMAECRTWVANQVCAPFWTKQGNPGNTAGCQNYFGSATESVFRWPDSSYVAWPAP